jgi:Type II secretion system (T2SS), protein E, N-terminal domain
VTQDALALAFRTGLPYVGLRDHTHDPDLDRVIPPDAARTTRAIPLAADDDRVRLAVADPDTDLSPLDRYLNGRHVELALAPRDELEAILGPPPPPPPPDEEPEPEAVPLAADPALPETAPAEPDSLVADGGPEQGTEGEPLAAAEAVPDGAAAAQPEPDATREPLAAAEAVPHEAAAAESDPELDGQVPSWLEPQRRRWRMVLAVLIVLIVLGGAAALVIAFGNV